MHKLQNIFLTVLFLACASAASAAEPVEVVITGVQGAALENVQKALALPYGVVRDGKVNTFWLQRFNTQIPEKVRAALEPFGYYHPDAGSLLNKTGENQYRIAVTINPGPPVRVNEVNLGLHGPGKDEKRLKELIAAFPLQKGDILLQQKYEEAKGGLRFRAIELGYLDAEFSSHTVEIDSDKNLARIDLAMETGRQYRFGSVRFDGVPRYPEAYLNRFITFKPGEIFSYAKLGETQLNLINSERFKTVFPVPQKEKAQDDSIPILIQAEEAPTKRLRPGIGYATDIGPRFSLEYRDLNVFERGHEFRGELNLSDRLQTLGAAYTLPDPADINSLAGVQLNFRREDVTTYTNQAVSSEINRVTSFRRGRLGTIYLRLEREDSTIGSEEIRSRLVVPGVRYSELRYDSLVRPKEGRQYTIDLRGTHQSFGSSTRFLQIVTEGNLLTPLPWRLSLYTRARAGATVHRAPVTELPLSYRFFAGGDRSVRGYAYQSLGPLNETGTVIGGRNILVGSIELDRALLTNWGVAVFYDAGNAFNSFSDFNLFHGAGIGLRYYTVVGALRLDIARQLHVPEPSYRIHFTVGFAF